MWRWVLIVSCFLFLVGIIGWQFREFVDNPHPLPTRPSTDFYFPL